MLNYSTTTFYKEQFKGNTIPDADLDKYIMLASLDIDIMTHNASLQYSNLPSYMQNIISMATCYEADFRYAKRDLPVENVESISNPDVKLTFNHSTAPKFDRTAKNLLDSTGITYAGFRG